MADRFTDREWSVAQRLYAEFVGYDLAARLPLRCQGVYQQRQWLAVARLAAELATGPALDVDIEVNRPVRVGFDDGITIPGMMRATLTDG